MHSRLFSKNRAKGYARYIGVNVVTSLINGVSANAIGSSVLTAAGNTGSVLVESLEVGMAGNAFLAGIIALHFARKADQGEFTNKGEFNFKEYNFISLSIAFMIIRLLAQMIGYGFLKNDIEMDLASSVKDTAVGSAILLLPVYLLTLYFFEDQLNFMEKPFRENIQLQVGQNQVQAQENRAANAVRAALYQVNQQPVGSEVRFSFHLPQNSYSGRSLPTIAPGGPTIPNSSVPSPRI